VLRSLTEPKPFQMTAIWLGIGHRASRSSSLRKWISARVATSAGRNSSGGARAADFTVDAVLLPSPYAFSFGGFVNLPTSLWFGSGGRARGHRDSWLKSQAPPAAGCRGRGAARGHEQHFLLRRWSYRRGCARGVGHRIVGLVVTLSVLKIIT
jgi:hypothetical protein